jgi:hypothetical protein
MRRILGFAFCLIFAAAVHGQRHPNVAKGFDPGQSYGTGDVDTINHFNGNLTLSIPIGQTFPLSTRLSYRFMLHYNSTIWDIEEAERPNPP